MTAATLAAAIALELAAAAAIGAGLAGSALMLHVAAAGALAHAFFRGRALDPRAALGTGWLWAGAFPLFGVLAGAALFVARRQRARRVVVAESWQERRSQAALRARQETERAQHVSADVVPLVDALRASHGTMRISAIEAVKDRSSKPIVLLLARERQNTLYDVRFRAAEHLSRINDQSLERIAEVERQLAANPRSAPLHERLAALLYEHTALGMDTPEITRRFLLRVVEESERAYAISGGSAPLLVTLARALWRLGHLERAERELYRAQEHDPQNGDALFALAELQFARKDFVGVQRICMLALLRKVPLAEPQRRVVERFARLAPSGAAP